jgi:hypothetical protein
MATSVLPRDDNWNRPGGNQTFALAGLGSLSIHVGVIVLVVLLFNFVISPGRDGGMEVESFVEGNPNAGGGGEGGGAIGDAPATPRIEKANADELPPNLSAPNVALGGTPDVQSPLPDLPSNPRTDHMLDDANDARSKLDNIGKTPSEKKKDGSGGRGGSGAGGGKGDSKGAGDGKGNAPGTPGTVRQKRNKRWTLTFNSGNGSDYLNQLSVLGAVLVGEFSDGSRIMYRKLDASPVPGEAVDPEIRQRMVWVDERPGSVRDLSGAMGLPRTPEAIKAYFPFKLENELLKLELAYRGKKEEEIHSTIFQVVLEGSSYRLYVVEQRLN